MTVPLTGSVSPVTMNYATYNNMGYIWMLPANYDATKRYPLLLFMHQDDNGNPYYQGGASNDVVGPQIKF